MSEVKVKSKTQRDIIISVLRSKFHESVQDKSLFPTAAIGVNVNINSIKNACYKNKKINPNPSTKNFIPIRFENVDNDIIPNMMLDFSYNIQKRELNVSSEAGMFSVEFSDGSKMLFAQRMVGMGKSRSTETYAVATKQTLNKYYGFLNKQAKINSKPKVGLFKIHVANDPMGVPRINYAPLTMKANNKKVYHQNKHLIEDDVQQFFENISLYTRFNQPGSRRLLLVGEPGGGKTSATNELALKYAEKMCVVIATDLKSVMMHTFNISKAKMPTLVILEDAESTIPWGNSEILNYLDGINQPMTEKGCYMILTTNFPQRIETRVLKRPGRIDKIIKFGILNEVNSLKCIKHYFEGILFDSEKGNRDAVQEILIQVYEKIIVGGDNEGMTGAQIKNMSEATISYAISNKVDKITVDTLLKVKEQLTKDLKDVYEMADDESMTHSKPSPIGFDNGANTKPSYGQHLDWDSIMNPKTTNTDGDNLPW